MARDRQRDDLAAEVTQAASAAKATTTSAAGQNRKAAVTHQRRSARSNRDAIQQHEDRQRDLITALSDLGGPVQHDLAGRLDRCQQARDGRRGWSNHGGIGLGVYPYQCRLFACWACRRSIIRRWEDKARRQFAAAVNSACTSVSIVLARVREVEAIRDIVAKARKDFGNLRAALHQQPGGWRWRSVQVFGIVGVDAVTLDDAALLTPGRSTLIPNFRVTAAVGNTLWVLCAGLAVHHPHLDRAELAWVIMRQWPGSEQVSIRAFEERQSAADNATAVVECAPEKFEDGWPPQRRAEFQSWLFGLRRGLQPLGISSRPIPEKGALCAEQIKNLMVEPARQDCETEPMPMLL